jgi:CIC family chloride channel protein
MVAAQVAEIFRKSEVRDVYPVIDDLGKLVGIITTEELKLLHADPSLIPLTTATDLMRPPASVQPTDDLRTALDKMVAIGAREIPVTDDGGRFVGYVEETAIARFYLQAHRGAESGIKDRSTEATAPEPTSAP